MRKEPATGDETDNNLKSFKVIFDCKSCVEFRSKH